MIDIKNSYIVNDSGELLELWYYEALRQGYKQYSHNSMNWYDMSHCYLYQKFEEVYMSTGAVPYGSGRDDLKELTLADFKVNKEK
jgi:hypothetical protein